MITARGFVISSRHAISCSTELASTSMSCGATSSCPRRFAKPIGVWHAATATDASTTSMAVSGRYATDAAQQPSWALVFRRRQPANHRAAQPSGTAHPQSSADPDPRSRDGARHGAQAGAQSESSDGSSPGSCRHGRRPQLRSACTEWYARLRTPWPIRATYVTLVLGGVASDGPLLRSWWLPRGGSNLLRGRDPAASPPSAHGLRAEQFRPHRNQSRNPVSRETGFRRSWGACETMLGYGYRDVQRV
jgi:hypothetical protein